jgi:hypothetical protein
MILASAFGLGDFTHRLEGELQDVLHGGLVFSPDAGRASVLPEPGIPSTQLSHKDLHLHQILVILQLLALCPPLSPRLWQSDMCVLLIVLVI